MGSSYLPPPEQNVVNVGDEISASTLAGLQYASPGGSQANPFATVSYVTTALSGITPPSLTGYAQLAGATFTGKVNFTTVSGVAGLNIGTGGTDGANTTPGDLWIPAGGTTLNYRDGTGSLRQILTTSQIGVIDTSATNPALRVTQRGTGEAFRVEDSNTPDATAFVISNNGKVGIGVAPDATAAVKVDNNGIKFSDNSLLTSVSVLQNTIQQAVISAMFNGNPVYYGSGSTYSSYPAYYDSNTSSDVYVDYQSTTYDYYVAWNPSAMVFGQTNYNEGYPSEDSIVATYYNPTQGGDWVLTADGSGGVKNNQPA